MGGLVTMGACFLVLFYYSIQSGQYRLVLVGTYLELVGLNEATVVRVILAPDLKRYCRK